MSECVRGFASRYIYKHGTGDSKATFRGNARHSEFEKMVHEPGFIPAPTSDLSPKEARIMSEGAAYVSKFLTLMRAKGGVLKPEVWVAINRDGSASRYGSTLPPYIRVKTDLYWRSADGRTLGTFDWKAGNWIPEENEVDHTQTRLTAVALLKQKPEAQAVIGGVIYTSHQKMFPLTVRRSEVENPTGEMRDLFARMAQYEEIQKGDMTTATRGRWCQFCKDTACPFNPSI